MKIYSAKQLQEADKITVENQQISGTELMERAASLVFEQIHQRLNNAEIPIKIFCGIGNNGGDGLVVARLLVQNGYEVEVFVVNYSDKRSQDFLINYDRYKERSNNWPETIKSQHNFPKINKGDFVVDAIFGLGLNRPVKGWPGELVKHINKSGAFVLAIDIPSGLYPDEAPRENTVIINADFTLTFQAPKLTFFFPETMDFVGDFQVLDIGLDPEFLAKTDTEARLISKAQAQLLYKIRKKNSHKGDYGHCLIVGGSYGKIGSISLSAKAALKSGAGLCSIFSPECGYQILQIAVPEAMVITDNEQHHLTRIEPGFKPDVIGFGMGAGTQKETASAFKKLLENTETPLLIDADGLNILAKNPSYLKLLPKKSVLTPHPGELKRLIGEWKDDTEKQKKVQEFVQQHKSILVLKGAYTFIFYDDEIYINNSGNPGMATAGSGDVLSGIITGLMAQKYDPLIASVLGVYIHGLSGNIAAQKIGYEALIAGDIIKHIGLAFLELFKEEV